MSSRWRLISDELWESQPPEVLTKVSVNDISTELISLREHELPSGLPGIRLTEGDHIALLVLSNDRLYYEAILRYVAAGIDNALRTEHLTLELTEGQSPELAREALMALVHRDLPSTVDIVPWERNRADYAPEFFDRDGMWRAMDKEARRFADDDPTAVLRVASEDCSNFMRWLRNPGDYLEYEYELGLDLSRRLGGRAFLQLCTFKKSNLEWLRDHQGISLTYSLLDIACSHNRLLVIDDGRLVNDATAIRHLLGLTWPVFRPSLITRWCRLLFRYLKSQV